MDKEAVAEVHNNAEKRDKARTAAIFKTAELLAVALESEKDPEERHKIAFAAMMAIRQATFEDALQLAKDVGAIKETADDDKIGTPVGNA